MNIATRSVLQGTMHHGTVKEKNIREEPQSEENKREKII